MDEYANVWDDYGYDYEDDWEPGIPSGPDDEHEDEVMDCG